jgi:hypothetical protein
VFPKLLRTKITITLIAGYGDKWASSAYIGVSVWQFVGWTKVGILPRGFPLTPGGKLFWSFRALDAAMDKAARSRKPQREHRGIVKVRLLRRRTEDRDACQSELADLPPISKPRRLKIAGRGGRSETVGRLAPNNRGEGGLTNE